MLGDCQHGFVCHSRLPNGGYNIDCADNFVINWDLYQWDWTCGPDVGQCPGKGGVSIGCATDSPLLPVECVFGDNPMEDQPCECDGQTIIDHDCSRGFLCLDDTPMVSEFG